MLTAYDIQQQARDERRQQAYDLGAEAAENDPRPTWASSDAREILTEQFGQAGADELAGEWQRGVREVPR